MTICDIAAPGEPTSRSVSAPSVCPFESLGCVVQSQRVEHIAGGIFSVFWARWRRGRGIQIGRSIGYLTVREVFLELPVAVTYPCIVVRAVLVQARSVVPVHVWIQ